MEREFTKSLRDVMNALSPEDRAEVERGAAEIVERNRVSPYRPRFDPVLTGLQAGSKEFARTFIGDSEQESD
jgi:hypothetical protein